MCCPSNCWSYFSQKLFNIKFTQPNMKKIYQKRGTKEINKEREAALVRTRLVTFLNRATLYSIPY